MLKLQTEVHFNSRLNNIQIIYKIKGGGNKASKSKKLTINKNTKNT